MHSRHAAKQNTQTPRRVTIDFSGPTRNNLLDNAQIADSHAQAVDQSTHTADKGTQTTSPTLQTATADQSTQTAHHHPETAQPRPTSTIPASSLRDFPPSLFSNETNVADLIVDVHELGAFACDVAIDVYVLSYLSLRILARWFRILMDVLLGFWIIILMIVAVLLVFFASALSFAAAAQVIWPRV